jgi:hypothetical protein
MAAGLPIPDEPPVITTVFMVFYILFVELRSSVELKKFKL